MWRLNIIQMETISKLNVSKERVMDIDIKGEELGKNEKKEQFILLRAKGFSYRDIENKLGVSRTTLGNWASELEEEIATLKAIELEALYKQYYLTKEAKIEALGEILDRLREELLSRDLSEVDTDKLLELILKYQDKLEAEKVEVRPLSQVEENLLKADKTRPKVDSVKEEIDIARLKLKTGLLDKDQFRQEIKALRAKLKAKDQEELEKKLNKLEAILDGRDNHGN